jgi:hypothetical protein
VLRRVIGLTVVLVSATATALASGHDGQRVGCGRQSEARFPHAFSSADNLVIGPLSMIGAGRETPAATVEEFDGNKFPVVVRAGHTVTVKVAPTSAGSLEYGGRRESRKITFTACGRARASSRADGQPVTFWSGSVRLSEPACVRLKVWIDHRSAPRRGRIAMGRSCEPAP